MNKRNLLFLFLLCAAFLRAEDVPKNMILFIGDGMGTAQLTAAKIAKGTLAMERCPVAGLVTTWSANQLVTDSAASGTAIATGVKTRNGLISIDPYGKRLKTVLELAGEKGKSTGLVSTCAVTHTTPAAFAAHVVNRRQSIEIARQLAASEVDVLFGGGRDHFDQSALNRLAEKMTIAKTAQEFYALGTPEKAAALLYPGHPPFAAARTVSLKEMTAKALAILEQDDDGFFLMVEGSQIDWAGHQNDAANLISEVLDFDAAVEAGLDFAEQNPDTLVIITADHETGGFALIDGSVEKRTVTKTEFSSENHSASIVPLFAIGPGSEQFSGLLDNTDIGKTMMRFIESSEE